MIKTLFDAARPSIEFPFNEGSEPIEFGVQYASEVCMRNIILLLTVLLGLLAAAIVFAYSGVMARDDMPLAFHGWAATAIGVVFSIAIGSGVMALMFVSSRGQIRRTPSRLGRPKADTSNPAD